MLPQRIMNESVTVIRAAESASRGTSERDWGAASTHVLKGVSVQESEGQSDLAGRDAATANATLYAQAGADVMRGDRIVAHGRTWTVTGAVRTMGPTMALSHMAATLREWEG